MPLFKCSASKAKPKNGIAYITDEKKAKIVSVRNLFEDEDYAKQFDETASRFGKGDKFDERKYSIKCYKYWRMCIYVVHQLDKRKNIIWSDKHRGISF